VHDLDGIDACYLWSFGKILSSIIFHVYACDLMILDMDLLEIYGFNEKNMILLTT